MHPAGHIYIALCPRTQERERPHVKRDKHIIQKQCLKPAHSLSKETILNPNPVFVQKAPLLAKGSSHSECFSSLHGLTEKALPPAISIPSRISLGQHCILWLPIQQLLRRHPSFFLMCCKHPSIPPSYRLTALQVQVFSSKWNELVEVPTTSTLVTGVIVSFGKNWVIKSWSSWALGTKVKKIQIPPA